MIFTFTRNPSCGAERRLEGGEGGPGPSSYRTSLVCAHEQDERDRRTE